MAMALSDFQDELRENIKRDSNGVSDTRLIRWLNWSQQYLADLHTYEEMREVFDGATVADQTRYGFPQRMKDIYTLILSDGASSRKLDYVKGRTFDEANPDPTLLGSTRSRFYVDYGLNFELYPIPDAVYDLVLRCSIYPADLANSTDESDLLRKDALITAIATVFGFYSLREIEDAAYWGTEIVPALFKASLSSDHSGEDWVPVARGLGGRGDVSVSGEWWKNPFSGRVG